MKSIICPVCVARGKEDYLAFEFLLTHLKDPLKVFSFFLLLSENSLLIFLPEIKGKEILGEWARVGTNVYVCE